jgi:UDP-N-acetylmuramyl pentapeptide synthase
MTWQTPKTNWNTDSAPSYTLSSQEGHDIYVNEMGWNYQFIIEPIPV